MARDFPKLNAELGVEFDRYLVEHPGWAEKQIPRGSQVVLQIEGDKAFNAWSRGLAEQTRPPDQVAVHILIKKLAPVRSRITNAAVLKAA